MATTLARLSIHFSRIILVLAVAACTQEKRGIELNPVNPLPRPSTVVPPNQSSTLPIDLDEQTLRNKYGLDTANLSFNFRYLDVSRSDKIVFNGGKATLEFHNLAYGKPGDLLLEILEKSIVRLRGTVPALTLTPGANHIVLTMQEVAVPGTGSGSGTGSTGTGSGSGTGSTGTGSGSSGSGSGSGASSGSGTSAGGNGDLTLDITIADPANGGNGAQQPQPTQPQPTQPQPTQPQPTQPQQPTNPNATSFARDLKPLMLTYCSECHHQGKALDLTNYPFGSGDQAAIAAKIISSVTTNMPPAPRDKMPADAVEKIKSWQAQGMNP